MGIFDRLFFGGFGSPQKNQRAAEKSRAMDSPLPLIMPPISTPAPIPTPIPIRNVGTPAPAPTPRIQPRAIAPGITPSAYDRDIGDAASRTIREFKPFEKMGRASNASDLVASSPFTRGNDPMRDALIEDRETRFRERPLDVPRGDLVDDVIIRTPPPPPPPPIVSGCMDRKATNFNPRATVSKPSMCKYEVKAPKPMSESRTISVTVTSNKPGNIFIDGKDTNSSPSKTFNYSGKELLTPKFFKVKKAGFTSEDEYKLYSVRKKFKKEIKPLIPFDDIVINEPDELVPIRPNGEFDDIGRFGGPLGFNDGFRDGRFGVDRIQTSLGFARPVKPKIIRKPRPISIVEYDFYEFRLEKNGKEVPLLNQINKITDTINKTQSVTLDFDLDKIIVIDPPKPTPYEVNIESFLGEDGIVRYETSWGQKGSLLDDDDLVLKHSSDGNKEEDTPEYIKFTAPSISDFTHTVTFTYDTPNKRKKTTNVTKDLTIELSSGVTNVVVNATKVPVEEAPTKPSVKASVNRVKLNLASDDNVKIPYTSINADKVIYTLGKTKREIELSGSLVLSKSDFYNGVGNYTIYLQPSSKRGGSGDVEKITVTVESRAFIPGPDITTINYPQNIKGADFKGLNVPFEVSWQSINTNYVHIYAGKKNGASFLGQFSPSGLASFNVVDIVRKLKAGKIKVDENRDVIQFSLVLIPFNEEGDAKTEGKNEVINITFDKGDLTLRRGNVITDLQSAFINQFDDSLFQESVSPFLTHYLHLGEGNNKLVATWGIDDDTLSTFEDDLENNTRKRVKTVKSLVLKLYEPLPPNVNPNDSIWLSKVQAIPLIDQITIINDITKDCIPLTPNFALETNDAIGYQVLDDLVASGSSTSADLIGQFVSSSEFSLENLDIQFTTSSKILVESNDGGNYFSETDTEDYYWKNFVKYSSAEERVENFVYKVKLIESYESKYNGLVSGSSIDFGSGTSSSITGSASSSVAITNEAKRTLDKINDTKKGFDAFEKYLYKTSGSLTLPGAGGSALSASSDSSFTNWYGGIVTSARDYDYYNTDRFVNNLPQHIQDDQEGTSFTLFFDMIGQHFDVLYTHIKAINQTRKTEHKFEKGINSDLIYHMLESLGFDADLGVQSQALWEYAFGKHSDGTVITEMSGKDRQHEIWRRVLNNLPYLYKHKGTKRAISAALSCYGVPNSLLTVMEFGGPQNRNSEATTTFTFEDRTASLNISGSESIIVPWKSHNSYYPEAVEVRINTEQRQDQRVISGSGWSVDIDYLESGSLGVFRLNVDNGTEFVSSSTSQMAFFNDEYTQIAVNRVTSSTDDTFTLHVKEGFQGRIRNEVSTSLDVANSTNGWEDGTLLQIGGTTLTGSIDEFRLWSAPLSESVIRNHTLMPDGINGNHISSSTDDLLFRLDFEYPKNRHSGADPYIKNVSINRTYETFATASNFQDVSSYPYQYKTYDRDVTAEVPSSGFGLGNKVRFESQTLKSNLTYRQRATTKSFDQAPLDSDKLGLFFSPIKEINMDIMKSLGGFNIDDYIGDPSDEFNDGYRSLESLRKYYFDRYNLNLSEYIQLVRYIDKSLFTTLESLVPARAKVSSGLLIEPHILERSKVQRKPTTALKNDFASSINVDDDVNVSSTKSGFVGIVTESKESNLSGNKGHYETFISSSEPTLAGSDSSYSSTVVASDDINQQGFITVNSGSDMGGISINVNAQFTGSLVGEYDSAQYEQIGMNPDSLAVAGFGLFGENGHAIITRLDKDNNFVKERKRVDIVTERYTVDVPQNIDSNDSSKGREFVTKTFNRKKLTIRDFAQSGSLVSGDVISQVPLNGHGVYHYRNVGDLTTGLENSYFNGSKQTSATTLDGGSPVETFTTNPNTLRVSDTGRGSGEPILEVD